MLGFFFFCFNFFIRSKSEPWLQLTRSSRWTGGQVEGARGAWDLVWIDGREMCNG